MFKKYRRASLPRFSVVVCCVHVLLGAELAHASPRQQAERSDQPLMIDGYYNIGKLHRRVTTESTSAQRWFDRGLAMCYAFNHEEAVRCFQKAVVEDPALAMAYWGLAYAMGPNINNMEIPNDQMAQANFALQLAELHQSNATDVEKQLISALALRYKTPIPDIDGRAPLNQAYAKSMRAMYQAHPDDSTVAVLFVESLLNLSPWDQWTKEGQPTEHTTEVVSVLESAIQKWPDHPALGHFYIHAMEASPYPEKAMRVANRLRNAMPGCGHLVHMPSHIDVLVGDYQRVVTTNQRAIAADKLFLQKEGANNFYTLYRIHNFHFVVYGAMFEGQSKLAMQTARELVAQIPPEMLAQQTDFLDAFIPMPLHVMIRFGRWDDVLQEPEPAKDLPMTTAVWRYARALAFAATQRVEQAEKELVSFRQAKSNVPESSVLFNNTSLDILGVAESMITGEIEYRKGNFDVAFEQLRVAVQRDDALHYDEPWGWMQPARHALGALLLEQRRFAEAEAVYREDLKRRPKNAWSLHGLKTCLAAQNKNDEAKLVSQAFEMASQRADIRIDRSCFCKLK